MSATGWECPRCAKVWAPHVSACDCVPAAKAKPLGVDPFVCPCSPLRGGSGVGGCHRPTIFTTSGVITIDTDTNTKWVTT